MSFLPSYTYFIAISLLVSLLVYRKPTYLYLKLFPPFLLLTLSAEIYAFWLYTLGKNNVAIYNFFSTFEFCFYLFTVGLLIKKAKARKIVWITILLYAIAAVTNILFFQGMKRFHTTTYAVGCLLVVTFCIYYFWELFRFPQPGRLLYNPAFWICTGLLFFYCCGFPLYGLINSWGKISKLVLQNFETIVTILNVFLYSLITIAFLCTRTRKYTSSPL